MINFEDELKKFHPSLEVEEVEDAIYGQDVTDLADVLVKMVKEEQEAQQRRQQQQHHQQQHQQQPPQQQA